MASRHARFVQLNRHRFGDEINQQLAMKIALHMGSDDSPATLKTKTLAAAVPCHYNTADKRTKEMAEAGLILMSRNGRIYDYSIIGEFEAGGSETAVANVSGSQLSELEARLRVVETAIQSLVNFTADLHMKVMSSSHEGHVTIMPPLYEYVNKEDKKGRREEEIHNGSGISHFGRPAVGIVSEVDPADRDMMIATICKEVRDVFGVGINEVDFQRVANALVGKGIKPEEIEGFDEWWQAEGWYDTTGKASLMHFFGAVDDFLRGASKKDNGRKGADGEIIVPNNLTPSNGSTARF